jgi:hypothetical protein
MDDHPAIRLGVLGGVADRIRTLDQTAIH